MDHFYVLPHVLEGLRYGLVGLPHCLLSSMYKCNRPEDLSSHHEAVTSDLSFQLIFTSNPNPTAEMASESGAY